MNDSVRLKTLDQIPETSVGDQDLDFWDGVDGLIKIQNVSPLCEKNQLQDKIVIGDKSVIDSKVSTHLL